MLAAIKPLKHQFRKKLIEDLKTSGLETVERIMQTEKGEFVELPKEYVIVCSLFSHCIFVLAIKHFIFTNFPYIGSRNRGFPKLIHLQRNEVMIGIIRTARNVILLDVKEILSQR